MVFNEIERALIDCQWPANRTTTSETETLAKASIDGEYATVLQSSASRGLLRVAHGFLSGAPLEQSLILEHEPLPTNEGHLFALILATTCLRAFTQLNWTGPDVVIRPSQVLTSKDNSPLDISDDELDRRCVGELSHGGEPVYHLAKSTAFLVIAKSLLSREYAHLKSVAWWRVRAESVHQQLLDEVVAVPDNYFVDVDKLEKEMEHGEQDNDLIGRLLLEKGLLRHLLHLDKLARQDFIKAARVMELKYELTGAMGKRTKFQQDDVAQLILLAESRFRVDNPSPVEGKAPGLPETLELNDDTLLETTEYTSSTPAGSSSPLSHLDPNSQPALHPLDQCILLGLCLNIKNTSPQHGLTSSQMFPYIARVISHPLNWSVHTMALLLRSRLEATRTRTVERSTLQLQALIDQMPTSDSSPQERLAYFWCINLPSSWEMGREVAKRYASLGVVKSAMEVFERLEMWEEVVHCWQALERPDKGLEIVRDLLEGKKEEADAIVLKGKEAKRNIQPMLDRAREAKFWCLLGELESERAVEHYEKAWEVSGNTSGRAMRSLGGYWFTRGEFDMAIDCLKRATTINPLYSRSWFILGCACLRKERLEEARDAFIRCVSIDDEDSESWNNLASAYLRMGFPTQPANSEDADSELRPENRVAVPFSNKMLAFRALQHGLKYSYNNWRMWANFMIVSVDVGELAEACRAMGRVVEERADKDGAESVDIAVLERLVDAVTRSSNDQPEEKGSASNPNEGLGLYKRVDDLFSRIILPRISTSPRIFRAYARLLVWRGRWSEALEAHEAAYRCGVAIDQSVETDLQKWRDAVNEVTEFVDVLRNFGPRASEEDKEGGGSEGKKKRHGTWQFRARTVVRTFMGRTKDSFENEPEWANLTNVLDDVKAP